MVDGNSLGPVEPVDGSLHRLEQRTREADVCYLNAAHFRYPAEKVPKVPCVLIYSIARPGRKEAVVHVLLSGLKSPQCPAKLWRALGQHLLAHGFRRAWGLGASRPEEEFTIEPG
jgi:hypothetical protein